VVSTELCPISDWKVELNNATLTSGWESTPIGRSAYRLSFARGTDLPQVDVQIAQGLPCQTEDPGTTLEYRKVCSDTEAVKRAGSQSALSSNLKSDKRYVMFDTMTQAEIFSVNPTPNYATARSNGYDYWFSSRREIKWSDNCPQTRTSVNNTKSRIKIISMAQLAMLIITLVVGCFDIYAAYQIYKELTDDIASNDEDTKRRQTKFDIGCGFINCVPNLVAIVIAFMSKNFYASLMSANCSDELTNSTFNYLADTISTLGSINIAKFCATFLYLCYSFYKYFSKYQKSCC